MTVLDTVKASSGAAPEPVLIAAIQAKQNELADLARKSTRLLHEREQWTAKRNCAAAAAERGEPGADAEYDAADAELKKRDAEFERVNLARIRPCRRYLALRCIRSVGSLVTFAPSVTGTRTINGLMSEVIEGRSPP